jgi:hypothetical protein
MKRSIRNTALALLSPFVTLALHAQVSLAPNQNPSFAVSRDKYMRSADSLTRTEGTTIHNTYRAYDWFEAREARKKEDREWRRVIQLERARNRTYYPGQYYQPNGSRSHRHSRTNHICPF